MRFFLLGHPLGHSISPQIHNAALRASGLEGWFELRDTPPRRLAQAVHGLRQPDVAGANVTVPYKLAVMPYLDELSPEAEQIGAVNTIANRAGRLVGFNTDGPGFLAALAEAGVPLQGAQVVLLGAGGAARAISHALVHSGVAALAVLNRDAGKAAALANELSLALAGAAGAPCRLEAGGLSAEELASKLAGAQLIVNATIVGMRDDLSLVPAELIPKGSTVCDIIYNPPETALLRHARAAGARPVNGLGMLVHQAAAAFSIWTGRSAPLAVMYRAAKEALEPVRAIT